MKLIHSINSEVQYILGTHFDKSYRENQIVAWIGLVCDYLKHPKRLLITNRESPETTLETPWGKLQILLGMKLTTDVTLPFFFNFTVLSYSATRTYTFITFPFTCSERKVCSTIKNAQNIVNMIECWCYKILQSIMAWHMNLLRIPVAILCNMPIVL